MDEGCNSSLHNVIYELCSNWNFKLGDEVNNMKSNKVTWEEVRANWVNGNLRDARRQLSSSSRLELSEIILEALMADHQFRGPGTRSGDLIDLIEILKSIARSA